MVIVSNKKTKWRYKKMKMRLIVMLVALSFLSGCGSGMCWYQSGKSLEQAVQDCRECHYDANKSVAAVDSAFEAGVKLSSLFRECMKSRGYLKIPQEKLPGNIRTTVIQHDWANSDIVAGN